MDKTHLENVFTPRSFMKNKKEKQSPAIAIDKSKAEEVKKKDSITQEYTMSKRQANETLQNVFLACNQVPNGTSIDKLMNTKKIRVKSYNTWMIIAVVALVFTFALPLLLNPFSNKLAPADRKKAQIVITDHKLLDDSFTLTLKGDFIDYNSICAIDGDGNTVYPITYDYKKGTVVLPYYDSEWNIYIYDLNQNELHLLLSPRN